MPRLSLWKPQKSNDYRFFDKTIKEMFTVGGTDLLIHKYLGPANTGPSTDITQPQILEPTATAIQDLLFLETRDRVYDPSVYRIRGQYNVANLDFDLSQFGLFLNNDTIFVTVHYNNMIDLIGRKLMVGDVFELPHLTDYHPLNETLPVSLRRFYQITDANFASEGFSQTWFPHLWRIKCEPLVNSQQFADIMTSPIYTDNYMGNWDAEKTYEPGYTVTYGGKNYTPIKDVPAGIDPTNTEYWKIDEGETLGDLISTYNKNIEINNAIIEESRRVVPLTGYDRSQLYLVPTNLENVPAPPINLVITNGSGPVLGTGTLNVVSNQQFRMASPVITISNAAANNLKAGTRVIISTGVTAVNRSDTNSGRVFGDPVLVVCPCPCPPDVVTITGPYGTADNTYATGDQYVNFYVTALPTPAQSTVIPLLTWTNDLTVGLVIRGSVTSSNGTVQSLFAAGTTITKLNQLNKTITVSNATAASVPASTNLEVSYDFTGTVTPDMNYRADCDPRFQYIRRASPRNFGYINAYGSGDGQAPNGEPVGTGITFPGTPVQGEYFLRTDYLPQKLFRWDGVAWREISQKVRTEMGVDLGSKNQLAGFINDDARTKTTNGQTVPQRQSLSQALKIQPD